MVKKMLVTLYGPFSGVFEKELLPILTDKGFEVIVESKAPMVDKEIVMEKIKDVDAHLICSEIMDKEVMDQAKKLKIVSKFGVGVDNIDLEEAKKHNIAVANTPGGNAISVAELVFGFMISVSRGITINNSQLKAGSWTPYMGSEISGKTLGIIGMGNIGKEIVKRAKGFDMDILAFDIVKDEEFARKTNVTFTKIEYIMSKSDFITLHVPLNEHTKNLIGKEELDLMKESAVLINAARGGVVDEDALYKALQEKQIAGAALDVFVGEPPKNMNLVKLEDLVTTPHIGGTTVDCVIREGKMAINNIINYLNGDDQVFRVV